MSIVKRKGSTKNSPSRPKSKLNELNTKEEEYKRLNEELEAKTAMLVNEAEKVIAEIDTGSNSSRARILDNIDPVEFLESMEHEDPSEYEKFKQLKSSQSLPTSSHGRPPRGKSSQARGSSARQPSPHCGAEDVALPDSTYMSDLQETFQQMSEQINKTDLVPGIPSEEFDDVLPSTAKDVGSEATIRFLKAKLHVMQEELDKFSQEFCEKEEENKNLLKQKKQVEEERTRQQKTITYQQSQIEKYKKMFEDGKAKNDGFETQLAALKRELDDIKRNNKKEESSHKATEVRLNRALEENEKFKEQLVKIKNESKDHSAQDKKRTEQLMADNRRLEKQKNELMTGFRKQLKLIDILKKQKLHMEASKMLSFTEEEFVKAMEWEA